MEFLTSLDGIDWAALKAALAADAFDNGRTPEQYRRSHEGSAAFVVVRDGPAYVGNGRLLSDGVCNSYLVDIWTAAPHRRRGIGARIVAELVARAPGQHVGLFTEERSDFYRRLGFAPQAGGMSRVVGSWLNR